MKRYYAIACRDGELHEYLFLGRERVSMFLWRSGFKVCFRHDSCPHRIVKMVPAKPKPVKRKRKAGR